jgi:hypothetical protein
MGQSSIDNYSEERYEICKGCEFFTPIKICSKCGCIMPMKVQIKSAECPIKKWEKEE